MLLPGAISVFSDDEIEAPTFNLDGAIM